MKIESNKFKNYLLLSLSFKDEGEYRKALDMLEKAKHFAVSEEQIIDIEFEVADVYILMEEFSAAMNCYKKIYLMDSTQSGAYYGYALSNELNGGDINLSIDFYEEAIKLDETYDRAYYYASILYDELGEEDKAIEYLLKCIELNDDDYIAYNDLGSLYERRGELELALEYLEKSIHLCDEYGLSLFNMGVVKNALGKRDEALFYYYKAKEEDDNEYIYLNISAMYIEDERYEDSIEILTEGLKRVGDSVILFYNRACSYSKLGDVNRAERDFLLALKCDERALEWAIEDDDLNGLPEVIRRRDNGNYKD